MKTRVAAAVAIVGLTLGGCGGSGPGGRSEELLVFAAASLTESFTQIGRAFEQEERYRSVRVLFNFGPSDGLANAIQGGGAADVFASASPTWMDQVAATPGVSDRAVFARNKLIVIVPKDNPEGIGSFADLAKPGLKLVLAAAAAPAGRYAREALEKAQLQVAERNVVSNEADVKGVLQKVLLGEADAGIVYATDVTAAVSPKVSVIAIPDEVNVIASYPVAVVRGTEHAATARGFVSFVLGGGRAILRDAGFLAP